MIGTIQQHIAAMEPDIPIDKVSLPLMFSCRYLLTG